MIVLSILSSKTRYYAICFEFQVRVVHIVHSFIWIFNTLKLCKEYKEEYIEWVDSIIRTDLTELFELVKTFKMHQQSNTYKRY